MNYETMLVTSAKLDEETTTSLVSKFKALIEENGTIEAVDDWGKRRLAFPINKEEFGVYTLIYFTSGPEFPAELRRVYGITDGVLRSIVIAREEGEEIVLRGRDTRVEAEEPAAEAGVAAKAAQEAAVDAVVATAEAEVAAETAEEAVVVAEAAEAVAEAAEEVAEEAVVEAEAAAEEAAKPAEEKEEASE